MTEDVVREHTRICSRHFLHSDPSNLPVLDVGKRFASPKKTTERNMRARKRALQSSSLPTSSKKEKCLSTTPSSSRATLVDAPTPGSTTDDEPMSVGIGEPLLSDFSVHVHELCVQSDDDKDMTTALAAHVELLEAETKYLGSLVDTETAPVFFRIEQISKRNSLVKFYTGFTSYVQLLTFFEFLGTSVYKLHYWGDSEQKTSMRRKNVALSPISSP